MPESPPALEEISISAATPSHGPDRRTATARLLKVYGPLVRAETAEHLERALRAGELGWTVECLATALVERRVPLAAGDAVEFRRLLTGFVLSPDTPPVIADLVLFGQDPPEDYLVCLSSAPDPFEVRAATAGHFPVPLDRIGVLIDGDPAPGTPDRPAVLITADPASGIHQMRYVVAVAETNSFTRAAATAARPRQPPSSASSPPDPASGSATEACGGTASSPNPDHTTDGSTNTR
jgi:hypothetical protein